MKELHEIIQSKFGISDKVLEYCIQKESELTQQFQAIETKVPSNVTDGSRQETTISHRRTCQKR